MLGLTTEKKLRDAHELLRNVMADAEARTGVKDYLKAVAEAKLPNDEVAYQFGTVGDEDRQYRAVVTLLQRQLEVETGGALQPGLSDADAQYNRGRAAALSDFLSLMEQARQRGRELIERNGRPE